MAKNSKKNGRNSVSVETQLSQFIDWDAMSGMAEVYTQQGVDFESTILSDLQGALKTGILPEGLVLTQNLEDIQALMGITTADANAIADEGYINPFANAEVTETSMRTGDGKIHAGLSSPRHRGVGNLNLDGAYTVHIVAVVNPNKFGVGHGSVGQLYGHKRIFANAGIWHSEKSYVCQDENLAVPKTDRNGKQLDGLYYKKAMINDKVLYESKSFVLPHAAFISVDDLGKKGGFFKTSQFEVVYIDANGVPAKSWSEGEALEALKNLFIVGFEKDLKIMQERIANYSIVTLAKEAKGMDAQAYKAFCLKVYTEFGLDEQSSNFGWIAYKHIRDTRGNITGDAADVSVFWQYRDAVNKVADCQYKLRNPKLKADEKDELEKELAIANGQIAGSRKRFCGQLPTDEDFASYSVNVLMDKYGYSADAYGFRNKAASFGVQIA